MLMRLSDGPQRLWLCLAGCVYLYRNHSEGYPGLVVGTGAEDYFDSSYVRCLMPAWNHPQYHTSRSAASASLLWCRHSHLSPAPFPDPHHNRTTALA